MVSKTLLIILFAGFSSATHLYGIIGESYHAPQPYKFGYQIKDKGGSHHRHEESDGHGNVKGSYGYTDDKGQYREVHYVADKGGFRAQVKTNEQGTANQNPAHVEVKADPPHHHFPHHELHHHHEPHVHIPYTHHVPHHHEVKVHHHVPTHHKLDIEPLNDFHHHEVKVHHHIPTHHELDIKPLNNFHHHDFKNNHHHDFKHDHHSFPHSSYKFDNFAPLHGFSYNPSLFHGHGHWPFQDSNSYGQWGKEDQKGYKFVTPHYRGLHSLSGFNFGKDFESGSNFGKGFESGSHKDKYDQIIEKIKKLKLEPLSNFEGFKNPSEYSFDNDGKEWKYGFDKEF